MLIDAETPDLDARSTVRALVQSDGRRGIVVLSHHSAATAGTVTSKRVLIVGKREGQASLLWAIRSVAKEALASAEWVHDMTWRRPSSPKKGSVQP